MTNVYTDERVRVFFNATKRCYSVKSHVKGKGWMLNHHATTLTLKDVKFIVNETTRQRVIAEKKKYEHAFIEGVISHERGFYDGDSVYYNPYKTSQFMANNKPIHECKEVTMVMDNNNPLIIAK